MATKHDPFSKLHSRFAEQNSAKHERQKKKKQRLMRRLGLLAVVVAVIAVSFVTLHIQQRHMQAEKKAELVEAKQDYAAVQKKGDKLKEERDLLKDEDYVLEIARTNYFFSKKGELIFKIPDEKPSY